MRANLFLVLAAVAFGLSADAMAEPLDASKSLVCDIVDASECGGVADCTEVTVEQIGLPPIWHVDFAESRVATPDAQRTSPIAAVEALDTVIVLQGHQRGHGWTMVIDRATGHLSAAIAGTEGAFVLAGACTAQ